MRRRSAKTVPGIGGPGSTEARLREVEGLQERGLISDAERDGLRGRILNEIWGDGLDPVVSLRSTTGYWLQSLRDATRRFLAASSSQEARLPSS